MLLHSGTGLEVATVVSTLCIFLSLNKTHVLSSSYQSQSLLLNTDGEHLIAVCSAVGVLPLSLQYGFSVVQKYGNSNSM